MHARRPSRACGDHPVLPFCTGLPHGYCPVGVRPVRSHWLAAESPRLTRDLARSQAVVETIGSARAYWLSLIGRYYTETPGRSIWLLSFSTDAGLDYP